MLGVMSLGEYRAEDEIESERSRFGVADWKLVMSECWPLMVRL